ncbi:AAEL012383-PA [Aedes aegypti]|uniref:AAEL012383-PA n=2 Tax=Aedes aegypti TaxID=7159 RepID=A0A1S4FWF9_AEDAE|nr:putative odorant-binding protein A10 [Aedes aegypti]EAT35447.1 AAEL012383-PA [Aedes aegypti]
MFSKVKSLSTRGAASTCTVRLVLVVVFMLAISQVAAQSSSTTTPEATSSSGNNGSSPSTPNKSQVSDEALDKALNDKRYLMRQLKCALGEVPCDPVGKRLKSLAPFVLRGACPQCTPAELVQIKKTLAHLQRNFPAEWNKLVQTYAG